MASVTVNDIDIVCRICVKCIWKSIYAAQPYLKSLRPVDGCYKKRQTLYAKFDISIIHINIMYNKLKMANK